jgi:REP element-mobilizing transposase RayT
MEKRKFKEGEANHVYQRTVSGFNIFYDVEDYIVYYTIFSVLAVRYDIIVYGLCLMIDHVHSLFTSRSASAMSGFISHVTSLFVKEYNSAHDRIGPLFEERFGSSVKSGIKLLRTAISYLYNNPVEKMLCSRAQDYRWNFLAYAHSRNPFSNKIIRKEASSKLRRIIKEIDYEAGRGMYLSYPQLRRMLSGLEKEERNQIIDYIISRYSVIRYDLLEGCYGGHDNMLMAINSNAGSEYEINEVKYGKSDREYRELIRYVREHGFKHAGDVISLSDDEKFDLYGRLSRCTSANRVQIGKFLHFYVKYK